MNITKQDILSSLAALPINKGDILLVHSSLKSAGYIEGGADTVIDALLETVGQQGTLVMPTLAMKDFDNAYKDWHIDRPSDTGHITEVFRKRKESIRSDQATHSVAAQGKMAEYLTKDHASGKTRYGTYGDTPFSHSSPWQRMYEENATVLLFGCGLDKSTLKHLVEYMVVEKMLNAAKQNGVYEQVASKILNFEARVAKDTSRVWLYTLDSEIERVGKRKNILYYSTCGNATLTAFKAKEFVNVLLEDISLNTANWYNSDVCNLMKLAFGGEIPKDAFIQ